jgi:RNA polymerase sigma-70 factor (ECF subfamily)
VKPDFDWDARADEWRRNGFSFALRILGNGDDAADAVQESLSILWARRQSIRRSQDPVAWFFRVLRNHCIDQLRKRRVRHHQPLDAENLADAPNHRPDAIAQNGEFRARLARELENLDVNHREMLILRDHQDLSYTQIAEILAVSPATVASRLHRARTMLRERLKDCL